MTGSVESARAWDRRPWGVIVTLREIVSVMYTRLWYSCDAENLVALASTQSTLEAIAQLACVAETPFDTFALCLPRPTISP